MRLLLDTHAMIWSVLEPENLSAAVRQHLTDPSNEVFFSVVGIWELAIKASMPKPGFSADVPRRVRAGCEAAGFTIMPVTIEHALAVGELSWHHKDPFDRLLVAQARCENCVLISNDRWLPHYPVALLW